MFVNQTNLLVVTVIFHPGVVEKNKFRKNFDSLFLLKRLNRKDTGYFAYYFQNIQYF